MKRGAIVISQELLKEILKGRIPNDFLLSGTEFKPEYNEIQLHGYSEEFKETSESCVHLNHRIHQCNLIVLENDLHLYTQYDVETKELIIEVEHKLKPNRNDGIQLFRIKTTLPDMKSETK
jgi:hypothetical protein